MEMSVDQTRREIRALEIDRLLRFVIAEADDAAVIDRNIRSVNFAAQNVNELRIFEGNSAGFSPRATQACVAIFLTVTPARRRVFRRRLQVATGSPAMIALKMAS